MASNQHIEEVRFSPGDLEQLLRSGSHMFQNIDLRNHAQFAQQLLPQPQPNTSGQRGRGRPRRRSLDVVQDITGLSLQEAKEAARDLLKMNAESWRSSEVACDLMAQADPHSPAPKTSKPRTNGSVRPSSKGTTVQGPWVEIVEQPKARGLRFRYECEGRSAGSIPGENSTPERKVFPSIKIHNYSGSAVIVVSCVTKDEPYKPHPHNLVGKDCKKGVCTLRIHDTNTISFPHLGIQCAKKKDVEGNLKMRQEINVDPYQTGFKHKSGNIDLNVVRLCFQVFLPDEQGKITRIVPPVVSQAIHDKKALNDLVICRVDRTSGKPNGGDEMFLLCEKINKDDVRVRFYEERDGQCTWEAFGDFGQNDVHRQYAIVFKTPPFYDAFLTQPKEVLMQLQRSSDLEGSDPISFTYQPEDPDPDRILEKRKRKAASLNFLQEPGSGMISQDTLKERLKLKATRTIASRVKPKPLVKDEAMSPELPQYTYNNISMQSPLDASAAMQSTNMMPNHMNLLSATVTTMASPNNMSSGNIQYTPMTSQEAHYQVPSITLNPQVLQLLVASGALTSQQPTYQLNESVQQQLPQQNMQPNPSMQQPLQSDLSSVQQMELLKLLLMQVAAHQQNQGQTGNLQMQTGNSQMPIITNNDPNMQSQATNSLGSFDQNLLHSYMTGDSPMISLEGLDGLSGSLNDLGYDPNVAGFETVGGDTQGAQERLDEASTAVRNLR